MLTFHDYQEDKMVSVKTNSIIPSIELGAY